MIFSAAGLFNLTHILNIPSLSSTVTDSTLNTTDTSVCVCVGVCVCGWVGGGDRVGGF